MSSVAIIDLFEGIRSADRRMLGKALSFIENTRDDEQSARSELLSLVAPYAGKAQRIGISGSPGAGKSTLIEALGIECISRGKKVAVLAVDPSSSVSGGSIMGDKVRMPELARSENAFIRPSPSGHVRGGTAQRTRECMLICEAAGYDTIIVETVGVGQAEYSISTMIDLFVLVLLPSAGDDVQAVKRGIMEIADIIWLNKADLSEAQSTMALSTLHAVKSLLRSRFALWDLEVLRGSALNNQGVTELADCCERFFQVCADEIQRRRSLQQGLWFDELLTERILQQYFKDTSHKEQFQSLRSEVILGNIMAPNAVERFLK